MEAHLFWNADTKSVFFSKLPKGQDRTDRFDHLCGAGLDGWWQSIAQWGTEGPRRNGMKDRLLHRKDVQQAVVTFWALKGCSHSALFICAGFLAMY